MTQALPSDAVAVVTGGTGYLGRALVRTLMKTCSRIVVIGRSVERHEAMERLEWHDPGVIEHCVGDVSDEHFMRRVLAKTEADVLFHLAAMKYVRWCQQDQDTATRINSGCIYSIFRAIRQGAVRRCVLASSDKAALPVNHYGVTKSKAEGMVIASSKIWRVVRLCNVMSSTGAVFDAWHRQAKSGFIEVHGKDPYRRDVERYVMTRQQAVDLMIASLELPDKARYFSAECPKVKMVEVAYAFRDVFYPGVEVIHRELDSPIDKTTEVFYDEKTQHVIPATDDGRIYRIRPGCDLASSLDHPTLTGDALRDFVAQVGGDTW